MEGLIWPCMFCLLLVMIKDSLNYQPNVKQQLTDKEQQYDVTTINPLRADNWKAGIPISLTKVTTMITFWLHEAGYNTYYAGKLMNGHNILNYHRPYANSFNSPACLDINDQHAYNFLDNAVPKDVPFSLPLPRSRPQLSSFLDEKVPRTPNFNPKVRCRLDPKPPAVTIGDWVAQDDHLYHKHTIDAAGLRPEVDHLSVMHNTKSPKFYGREFWIFFRGCGHQEHKQGPGTSLANFERGHGTSNEIPDGRVPYFSPQKCILVGGQLPRFLPFWGSLPEEIYAGLKTAIHKMQAFITKAYEPHAATGSYSVTPKSLRWSTTQSPTVDQSSINYNDTFYVVRLQPLAGINEMVGEAVSRLDAADLLKSTYISQITESP
ncbi:hypothetical protein B0H17DRAFT_1130463 [Mycena rosella]|uniref:Uncharacterized protein n=1 Tax=Mycena rosella TaxID=1033263 RepID=A0AAD7DSB8_MYCRO|nr:hypothetical protein B0H17DRAFT_1130463 [Mycena rosella]